jgi:alkanesulfonate monooxygenase SsuD/methylene tetrahydromethanopterin reductase-like flavin-dependent oxidoreductase (luciferase family)
MPAQIAISPFGSSRASVLALARRAADAELDGLVLGDGFVATPTFPIWSGGIDCFVELAWLAGSVLMRSYGVDAVVAPLRDPRALAKQAASLSAVTEGRTHLALTAGFWEQDAKLFGFDFEDRGQRLDEAIRALLAAYRGEAFEGRFWKWDVPTTISPCHAVELPELWLSGGEATMRRAVTYGLPFQPTPLVPGEMAPVAQRYRDAGGKQLKVRARMSVETPVTRAGALAFPYLTGDPQFLTDQLAEYEGLGADYISIVAGYDDASCAATIDALGLARQALQAA